MIKVAFAFILDLTTPIYEIFLPAQIIVEFFVVK